MPHDSPVSALRLPREGLAHVFVGIDVHADGTVAVRLWRGQKWNALYARCDMQTALARHLPQALAEAVEMAAQSAAASGS